MAVAIGPTEVRSISIGAVRDHLSRNPDALWSLARDLAHQVQRARLRAEMLAMKRLADRLDAWLVMHEGKLPPKGEWLPLAGELGITPEALYTGSWRAVGEASIRPHAFLNELPFRTCLAATALLR